MLKVLQMTLFSPIGFLYPAPHPPGLTRFLMDIYCQQSVVSIPHNVTSISGIFVKPKLFLDLIFSQTYSSPQKSLKGPWRTAAISTFNICSNLPSITISFSVFPDVPVKHLPKPLELSSEAFLLKRLISLSTSDFFFCVLTAHCSFISIFTLSLVYLSVIMSLSASWRQGAGFPSCLLLTIGT